jgi:hypothetical protein
MHLLVTTGTRLENHPLSPVICLEQPESINQMFFKSPTSSSESESESLWWLFLLPELKAMVQKPSLAKQLSPLRFLDDFLFLRRSPSSSLLLELEVEYAELESTSLAPTITRALPRLSFFLDRRSSLYLFLCLLLWSRLDRYLFSVLYLFL